MEDSWDALGAEQAIGTKVFQHKSIKRKSLTQSKIKITSSYVQGIRSKIMDRGDTSIEKVAEQFLEEGQEIINNYCL